MSHRRTRSQCGRRDRRPYIFGPDPSLLWKPHRRGGGGGDSNGRDDRRGDG
ncbi:MAG: hypothetical protein U9Q16_02010 [Patescibacteria group bacterium]|nr:hypothetical protein [Patescibacteria group bacterium]